MGRGAGSFDSGKVRLPWGGGSLSIEGGFSLVSGACCGGLGGHQHSTSPDLIFDVVRHTEDGIWCALWRHVESLGWAWALLGRGVAPWGTAYMHRSCQWQRRSGLGLWFEVTFARGMEGVGATRL